jgi:outer membrane protein OmpA-like peptidoglycan-associated protein
MRGFIFKGCLPGGAGFRKGFMALSLGGLLLSILPCRIFPQEAPGDATTLTGPAKALAGSVRLSADYTGPYKLVEISDWSRYDNGKYIGHVYHEVRASIKPEPAAGRAGAAGPSANSFRYRGNFYVLEETLRDMRQSARPVDQVIPVSFAVERDGSVALEEDRGYPSLRGFPAFPAEPVRPGSKWVAQGSRAVDPLNTGQPVTVPLIAEYEYRGVELYREIPVHRISAKYALRYRVPSSWDGGFTGLQGTHGVDILLKTADGLPLLMRDTMDETFSWPDGSTLRFKGFTLTFSEGAMPLNRTAMITSIGSALKPEKPPAQIPGVEDGKGIDLVSVPEGIRLVVKDIRFVPDSDELLPEERPRLDIIAEALKQAGPDRNFLVEGHTASLGRAAGEMELSVRRARRMVDELAGRGINASRFIYKGWGGTKPAGDNSSEEGRRLNRRVEITILE